MKALTLDAACAAAPPRRWWARWWRRPVGHEWMVTWRHQTTPLWAARMLLALDSGKREPECMIFCARCGEEHRNEQAPVAAGLYALSDMDDWRTVHGVRFHRGADGTRPD